MKVHVFFCSDSRPFGPYYYGKTVFHTKVRKRLVGVWRRIATRGDKSNWLRAAILTALTFILPCLNLQEKNYLFSVMSYLVIWCRSGLQTMLIVKLHMCNRISIWISQFEVINFLLLLFSIFIIVHILATNI